MEEGKVLYSRIILKKFEEKRNLYKAALDRWVVWKET